MMYLSHSSLSYNFSGLNPNTHYIVIPQNSSNYVKTNDFTKAGEEGCDYNYGTATDDAGVWVVAAYAGTGWPYSTGLCFDGEFLGTSTATGIGETVKVVFIRKEDKLSGAAATYDDLLKSANRTIVLGVADATDLAALAYSQSKKIDLSRLVLDNVDIQNVANTSVEYLALPGTGDVSHFIPSVLKTKCPQLKGLGMYHLKTGTEPYNKLYYSSWAAGHAHHVTQMMPELAGDDDTGLRAYKMWGPLNMDDICSSNNHANGAFPTTQLIYSADLSMAWFPTQTDMQLTDNGTYSSTSFVECILPRTNMTLIPAEALENRQGITYLAIPDIYTTIGEEAFYLTKITQIDVHDIVSTSETDVDGVTFGTDKKSVYEYNSDNALIKKVLTNGPQTVTLPASLGHAEGEGLHTGSMQVSEKIKEVYVLAAQAPYCARDAFGSVAYVGNNTFAGIQALPFSRDKYRMSYGSLSEAEEDKWIAVLHLPSGITEAEARNYTDLTRDYSLTDGTGELDAKGVPLTWPNQAEYLRAFNQAVTGVTWEAWDATRDAQNSLEYGTYNEATPGKNIEGTTATYDAEHYMGWHQFVLASTSLYVPEADEDETEFDYELTDWCTFCIPFNMSKADVVKLLGVPASTDKITRNYTDKDGVKQKAEANVLPDIRTMVGVVRTKHSASMDNKITIHLSENIAAHNKDINVGLRETTYDVVRSHVKDENGTERTGEDNEIFIRGGYPYFVRAYLPKDVKQAMKEQGVSLAAITMQRSNFSQKNIGNTKPFTFSGSTVNFQAPFEVKVQAEYVNGSTRHFAKSDDKADNSAELDNDDFIYTFVGQYWQQQLPLGCYYLGAGNKFYRATAPLGDSEVWSKWAWKPYVAVITPTTGASNTIVVEPLYGGASKGYMRDLSMTFGAEDDSFDKTSWARSIEIVFDDGIVEVGDDGSVATKIEVLDGVEIPSATAKVFNLRGQYVGNTLNGLSKGMYIMNGKKVVVK
jgi:hypothetical protein